MDDPQPMGLGDAARQLLGQACRLPRRPRGSVELLVEAAARDELQLEESQALRLTDVVDLHDMWVLEPRHRLGLGEEAGGGLGRGIGAGQDHFQGAGAVEPGLAGLVNDAHAAAAQLARDLVAGDDGGRAAAPLRRGFVGAGGGVRVRRRAEARRGRGRSTDVRDRAVEVSAGHGSAARFGNGCIRLVSDPPAIGTGRGRAQGGMVDTRGVRVGWVGHRELPGHDTKIRSYMPRSPRVPVPRPW